MKNNPTIAFIGGGNMAHCLIGGLLATGFPASQLLVADPDPDKGASYQTLDPAIIVSTSNADIASNADIVVFAVKPQIMRAVVTGLKNQICNTNKLIISIAAGIPESSITQWLEAAEAIVRCMPNTPALVQAGASALYANEHTNTEQREMAETIIRAAGVTVWVDDENQMDAVTALSGSGPAYFFLMMEAMQIAGEKLGLSVETAHLLTLETALGAAKLAIESGEDPAILRQRVTSKGGTTEQALKVLNENDYSGIIYKAMQAAAKRSAELAEE